MADEVVGTASIDISLDEGSTVRDAARLGDRIEQVLARAARDAGRRMVREIRQAVRDISPVRIRVEADLRAFGHSIDTLRNFDAVTIPVEADLDRLIDDIRARLAGETFSINIVPDFDGFDARIRAHRAPDVNVNVNADNDNVSRFLAVIDGIGRQASRAVGPLTSLLRVGALGIAFAGAAQSAIAFTAALAPAAGILAAGPAAALGYAGAIGTLKFALQDVGDLFKSALNDDTEKFNKELEKFSPAAQKAAKEVRGLKPAFDRLRESVQSAFFGGIEGQITKTATALKPLGQNLVNIADQWSLAAKNALQYIRSNEAVGNLRNILQASRDGVAGLAAATQPVIKGFLDIGGAVAEAFGTRASGAIARAGEGVGAFLTRLADSGRAVQLVENALTVFKQLGTIASNVGGILSGVFGAANGVGGGFLNNLTAITGKFREFVNSAKGQEAIGNIFKTLSTVAAQLSPILAALVTQVGKIAPALAPVFTAIGPAITGVINALGPAIAGILPGVQAVAKGLADAFGILSSSGALQAVGKGVGDILTAIAPLLPLVGQLAASVGQVLGPALSAVATALAPVVSALVDALAPVLPPLTQGFVQLVTALTPVVTLLGQGLAQAIGAIAPLLPTIALAFQQIAVALTPVIQQLVTQLAPQLPVFVGLFTQLTTALLPLAPTFANLVTTIAPFIGQILQLIGPALQLNTAILGWVGFNVVIPVINGLVTAVGLFVDSINLMRDSASIATSVVMGVFSTMSAVVGGVVTALQGLVTGSFSQMSAGVQGIVSALSSAVTSLFAALPARVRGAIASTVSVISSVFSNARAAAIATISALISSATSLLASFPGRARAALGSLGSVLASAGRSLVDGLIAGIRGRIGSAVATARSLASSVAGAVKGALKINSPSRVMIPIGHGVGEGLVVGMDGSKKQVQAAAKRLAQAIQSIGQTVKSKDFITSLTGTSSQINSAIKQLQNQIRSAFKGARTNVDDQLIKKLSAANTKLQKLANQRDKIAAKIQAAQQFASQTTQNVRNAFSLQNVAAQVTPKGGALNVDALVGGLDAAAAKIRRFQSQITALAKRGLNKSILQQLIGLGPEQGAALTDALSKASAQQIADLSDAQKQLDKTAKSFGDKSADLLFDSGKNAAKGFLQGLKDQEAAIKKQLTDLAKSVAETIKKTLKIKSPSRVTAELGRFTGAGLAKGIEASVPSVARASQRMAAASVAGNFGAPVRLGGRGTATSSSAAGRSTTSNRNITVNQTVYEAVNGRDTAERVLQRLLTAAGPL